MGLYLGARTVLSSILDYPQVALTVVNPDENASVITYLYISICHSV